MTPRPYFLEFRAFRGQNRKIWIHTNVRICIIYRLRPKKAKNLENCDPCDIWEKNFFEKKFFGVLGIPPKWKKGENFEIYKSIENIFMVILSPHWGVLGEK